MNTTIIPFPVHRTRPRPVYLHVTRPGTFDEQLAQAERMGGWLHYCAAHQARLIVKKDTCCPACGGSPDAEPAYQ